MKEPRPSKTTMSPRWMSPLSASGRHTVIESSTSRVGSIEALGMVKRWMTNPRIDPPRRTMRIAMAPIVFQNRAEHRRRDPKVARSEEHTSELQSRGHLVCRLLLEKKKTRQHQRLR